MSKKILVATIAIFCTLLPTDSAAQYFYIPVHRTNLLFAGDIMQHQNQLDAARTTEGTYSYSGYYRHIQGVVKSADIAVANLETPIGRSNFSGYPSFCAPDSFLYAARDAGFNVLLFANNHCNDYGTSGMLRTTGADGQMLTATALAQAAFNNSFGSFGNVFVAICLLFFAFSTIVGWYFFGEQNVRYLFGSKAVKPYAILVCVCIVAGCALKVDLVWAMADMFNGLMVLPNLMGLLALTGVANELIKDYEKQPAKAK